MDNQTLQRIGYISNRLYCNDITYFVDFHKTCVIITADNFSITFLYKRYRSKGIPIYKLTDRINDRVKDFKDFRLLKQEFYELIDNTLKH